jgi:hypothetical protein
VITTVAADGSPGAWGQAPAPFLPPIDVQDGRGITGARARGRGGALGGILIAVATGLLFLLRTGLFAASLNTQYRYVFHARYQPAARWVEALSLDLVMAISSLLALGRARAGKPARAERVLTTACAGSSGMMNFAAANDASAKSVLPYVMPPVFLAVVADRVISTARRHAIGQGERSRWRAAAPLALYAVRLAPAPPGTAAGLRVGPRNLVTVNTRSLSAPSGMWGPTS